MEHALLVGALVDLGVHDDPHLDAAPAGGLQRVGHRLVAELVEAAEEGVAPARLADEAQQGVLQVTLQPAQRLLPPA